MSRTRKLAILLFDDVEVLDFCGPLEVFSIASRQTDPPALDVFTVVEKPGPVVAWNGLSVNPQHVLTGCPTPDVLLVPGGLGTRREMHNAPLIDWIKRTAAVILKLVSASTDHVDGSDCVLVCQVVVENLKVQLVGTLPGSGFEPVLITSVVPVKVAASPKRPAGGHANGLPPNTSRNGIALRFEAWEFQETDGQLWLKFRKVAEKDDPLHHCRFPLSVQLAGVKTKFVPLVYFKGSDDERKKQQEVNDVIAAFIAEQLKGKTVWIEDAKPVIFAGPSQVMGIVWFDPDRKRSLQQLLVEKGLAVKLDQP